LKFQPDAPAGSRFILPFFCGHYNNLPKELQSHGLFFYGKNEKSPLKRT
jgi:hypothetical protein